MFEQQLYEPETVSTPLAEGDLFHAYEIKPWVLSSRLYKILGISAIGNILAILIVAQTSLLTMKGCDSPLVGSVCQVLDTVYVGTMLLGTNREQVDVAYDRTDLGDMDITYVDVSGETPPLSYPAGYFQLANPEMALVDNSINDLGNMTSGIPGIPSGIPYSSPSTGGGLIDTTPHYPTPKGDVVDGDLPTFGNGSGTASNPTIQNPTFKKRRPGGRIRVPYENGNVNANTNPTLDPNNVAGIGNINANTAPPKIDPPKVDPTAPVDPNAINNRPLVDLSNFVNDLMDKNLYKLDSQFSINAKGKLNKDGKFDKTTFKYIKTESADKSTIDVLKAAIEAINDSGRLKVLEQLTGKDLNLNLSQDTTNLSAVVESVMESDLRANSVKSNLELAIAFAKNSKSGPGADQNDKDDLLLLNNAKIEVEGSKVIIRFFAPKEILLPMIQRKLAEEKAKPKQPNGNAAVKPSTNAAEE
ncbi:hypothetical protein BH10ACI3_BH10ACI3_18390 [soil metagenome]